MGLGNNSGRFTYANISKGKIAVKQEGVINLYGYLEGWLKDIQVQDAEYQGKKYKKLCLFIDDGVETFQLQMKLDSGYGRAFCRIIPNANLKLPIRICPNYSEDGEKKLSGMFIDQDGTPLKWFYKKDTPHDLPPMEQITFKGETVWDNSKQQSFFINMLLKTIRPQLDSAALEQPPPASFGTVYQPSPEDIEEPVTDLPF